MSLFKSKRIVLKKTSKKENNEDIFSVFSLDYGKIQVTKKTSKKEKNIDIGYLLDFEIETSEKSNINKIKSIKILGEFNYNDKEFKVINMYMEIINTVFRNTPNGLSIPSLFELLEYIGKDNKINYTKLLLAKLKILNILGILDSNNNDLIINKILNFIQKNHISQIFLLNGIDDKIEEKLYLIK